MKYKSKLLELLFLSKIKPDIATYQHECCYDNKTDFLPPPKKNTLVLYLSSKNNLKGRYEICFENMYMRIWMKVGI